MSSYSNLFSNHSSYLTPELRDEIISQVRNLATDTLSLDDYFDNISQMLYSLQASEKVPEQVISDIKRLTTTWSRLHTEYQKILWDSREVASYAYRAARDFANVFIHNVLLHIPTADMGEAIEKYQVQLANDKTRAKYLIGSFEKFQKEFAIFCQEWTRITQTKNSRNLGGKYKQYGEQITSLNNSVRMMNLKIATLCFTLAVLAAAAGAFALVNIIHGNIDLFLTTAAGAISGSVGLVNRIKELMKQKSVELDELNRIKIQVGTNEDYVRDVRNIAGKLSCITCLWNWIITDLHEIKRQVEQAPVGQDKNSQHWREEFNEQIQTVAKNYRGLADIFDEYQITVTK
ncbi:hypothetical protein QCA50_006103 [Cerrena zonata]|uniref:Uncharacterized protein n=1 Tax=Cerrena zonata TaxID=2478898 RepID=A0AAW0GP47_9APHY